ncbi:MAG: DUF4212 domain-containing protein [Alphaproteobacteria bacterium]|nr:DUF4212 domain-containing protein [Alphaproteobacteria bacterium]
MDKEYWQENLKLIRNCLIVWFVCSFLFGIIMIDLLNHIRLGGYGLGFWFAQQGSIVVFVVIIFYYARQMDKLDAKYGFDKKEGDKE